MKLNKQIWISLGVLLGISALAYLPLIHKMGYMNDDWYLMYEGSVRGASYFHEIFIIDRPLRGYVMEAAFSLFGLNPLPYHISAFVFRLLSGGGLFWLCNQLWPKSKMGNLLVSILFLIYPGFLSQVNPIDYQSQIISLACAVFSIALTIKAIRSVKQGKKWIYIILSILLAWIYLGLVEYFIGLEVLRLTCVALFFWRDKGKSISARLSSSTSILFSFIVGAGGFLIWRLFFFSVDRKATDVGMQLSSLFSSPLTGVWWLIYLIQDIFKVVIVAWVVPLDSYAFSLRLRDAFLGFGLAILGVLIMIAVFRWMGTNEKANESESGERSKENREKLWVAIVTIAAGLLPVIIVNRHVILPDYSRYTLSASVGVAILVVVFIEQLSTRSLRMGASSVLIAIAVLTHYGKSVKVAAETEAMQEFWWQVAWRAPQIKSGTTLSASYPNIAIQEDYFIWGPANHIYFPDGNMNDVFQVDLSAVVLDEDNVSRIIAGKSQESFYRRGDMLIVNDYSNILVMTQANENSCVRIINGKTPELSVYDQHRAMLISPNSKLDNVALDGASPSPPSLIFGSEPPHEWCYYYQKADLARQKGDWNNVVALYEEAIQAGFHPNDQIELMPFLQAYAMLGNQKQVKNISTRINTHVFYKQQACRNFIQMAEDGVLLTPEMQDYMDELFCQ